MQRNKNCNAFQRNKYHLHINTQHGAIYAGQCGAVECKTQQWFSTLFRYTLPMQCNATQLTNNAIMQCNATKLKKDI